MGSRILMDMVTLLTYCERLWDWWNAPSKNGRKAKAKANATRHLICAKQLLKLKDSNLIWWSDAPMPNCQWWSPSKDTPHLTILPRLMPSFFFFLFSFFFYSFFSFLSIANDERGLLLSWVCFYFIIKLLIIIIYIGPLSEVIQS